MNALVLWKPFFSLPRILRGLTRFSDHFRAGDKKMSLEHFWGIKAEKYFYPNSFDLLKYVEKLVRPERRYDGYAAPSPYYLCS